MPRPWPSTMTTTGDNKGAMDIALPRWAALEGVAGAEPALLSLGEGAHEREHRPRTARLRRRVHRPFDPDRRDGQRPRGPLHGVPAVGTPLPLPRCSDHGDDVLPGLGGHRAPVRAARRAAGALTNQVSVAIRPRPGRRADHRSRGRRGRTTQRCAAEHRPGHGNYLLSLWTAGRLTEAAEVHRSARETMVDPGSRLMLTAVGRWLAEATGSAPSRPPSRATSARPTTRTS